MKIICDSCSTKYSIADEKVRGKVFKIKCKKCSHIIVVRGAAAEQPDDGQPAYDEKETKVFDYAGYDDPKEAAAAMAAAGGDAIIWHLVIDQEQVGPMTAADVQERFQSGQIDGDTYVWREGFADWLRLAQAEELAGVLAAGAGALQAPAPAAAPHGDDLGHNDGLFGGAPVDDGGTVQSDPNDLFAAAQAEAERSSGSSPELFGGAGQEPHPDDGQQDYAYAAAGAVDSGDPGGLFGDDVDGGGAHVGDGPVVHQLTAQRNENSVLFSLSNLASIAGENKAAAAAAASAPGPGAAGTPTNGSPQVQPVMGETAGREGSGLIDIRAMASAYLGEHKSDGLGGPVPARADDLPMLGAAALDGGSSVLLPSAGADAGADKLKYSLMGLIGVLVVVIAWMGFKIMTGGDDKPQTVASVVSGDETPGTDKAGMSPTRGGTLPGDTSGKGAGAAEDGTRGTDSPATAPTDGSDEPTGGAGTPPKATTARKAKTSSRRRSQGRTKPRSNRRNVTRSAPSRSEPAERPSKPEKSAPCDEVACLVDPSLPCCKKSSRSSSSSSRRSSTRSEPKSDLPESLTRTDVSKGISKVRGRVISCGDRHNFKGTVTVKISVSSSGNVSRASANKGGSAFQSCITSAIKNARFNKTQKGLTVRYPFVFR